MLRDILTSRVRLLLDREDDVWETDMLEGRAFVAAGHVAVCVSHEGDLLVRTSYASAHLSLDDDGPVTAFISHGPGARSWLRVNPSAVADEASLRGWVAVGTAVARSLPPVAI